MDLIISHLQKLSSHSYASKAQAKSLKMRKETIINETALFLGDFAENYSFVIQDEIQSFHWNNQQCSLHPVVIYYKHNGDLQHRSYCVTSEDLKHDVAFVHSVIKVVLEDLKGKCPNVKHIEYFSDGCAQQYKNRSIFINLCHYKKDFKLDAVWNFFATTHGKQPCDGIGGTVKELVA